MPEPANPALQTRSLPGAMGLGLLIGLACALALAILAFLGSSLYVQTGRLQGTWSALGAGLGAAYLAVSGSVVLPLAGLLLGGRWLRMRRRRRFTFLYFPLALFPVAALIMAVAWGAWAGGGRDAWDRVQTARRLQWAFANRSSNAIVHADFYLDPLKSPDGDAWEPLTPAAPVVLHSGEAITPAWSAERTVIVSWQRILPCGSPDTLHCGGDGDLLEAHVRLPRYSGRWNKAYVVVFLPHDRVAIAVVDRRRFDGKVNAFPEEALAAQGELKH